jgi:hypothetical protein
MVFMPGMFTLRSPKDLLAKPQRELDRLRAAPNESDIAFNFFVTAEHIADWLHPGPQGDKAARKERERLRDADPLLAVVSHIANGSKHFDKLAVRHDSVKAAGFVVTRGVPLGRWGVRALLLQRQTLTVTLTGDAAKKYGTSTTPLQLAEKVADYWQSRPEFL